MIKHFLITGDCHGKIKDRLIYIKEDMPEYEPNETAIIILGDVGFQYYKNKKDWKLKHDAMKFGYIIYCLRGNHEDRISNSKDAHRIYDNEVKGYVWIEDEFPNIKYFDDDFGEYLKKSIIANMVANTYRDKIKDLYNQWAAYADSDQNGTFDLTEQEAALLREAQKSLAEQMIKERDAMADVFGWENLSSQEASAKGFETMSQDTADELNGRFTALQLSNESIKTILDSHTPLIETIMADTSQIRSSIALQTQYITEIADIQRESNDHLSAISKNTYQLYQMNERLDKIERNTRNI